ncbi:DUF6221 family protein [Streptomyces scabiei]|uniref:DUF6221 family protein n=1 Tax=Streptomyces scabiei TaxID=1930 RepID=UPI0029B19194|nr:DUF6221 family protein [Streptomyces scabiei]MDX2658327.1 DUF6221 family protein [Streptomyces scabiei]MDX2870484.1 DUF6221 family protein [Streptomyces scabiei]MDX3175293.1 DUF6221 family protein [Streptomyces scabiei]
MTAQGEDVLAWLGSAIARRRAIAEAASPGPWESVGIGDYGWTVSVQRRDGGLETDDSDQGRADAEHVVANAPESVLRRCDADRKLLEEHAPQQDGSGFPDSLQCRTCSQSGGDGYQYLVPFPCTTVRALAEGYGWAGGER